MVTPDPGTLSGYPVAVLLEWLAVSCAAQGVPVAVRDTAVVNDVAVLLGVAQDGRRGRARGPACGKRPATPPPGPS